MPTYAYQCQACDHRFEKFQSMTARILRKCPECAESSLERLIGPGAGIIFRGSGFYSTDYRSDSYKAGEKAATDQKESAAKPADSGTEKPAGTDKTTPKSSD